MTRLLKAIYLLEINLAVHVGALGDFWAGRAARRLGILAENYPGDFQK